MGEIIRSGTPRAKHLVSAETMARVAHASTDTDLTRHRGQSNGLRVHGIAFAAVSLAVLVMLIAAIALASSMM